MVNAIDAALTIRSSYRDAPLAMLHVDHASQGISA